MKKYALPILGVVAAVAIQAAFLVNDSIAQTKSWKDQVVGTWAFVSAVNTLPDGTKFEPNGPNATGILMLDSAGNFSWEILRPDIPKLASNNRQKGTPQEFEAVAKGALAYFGTYSVDEQAKTITMQIVASSFPNFNGANQT